MSSGNKLPRQKKDPWELRKGRGKENSPGRRRSGQVLGCSIESHTGSSLLRVFIWRRSRGRIDVEYSSVFQVCPFRDMVSTE